jgi:aryl-alcohol dehydrogenase
MRIRAAVARAAGGPFTIEEADIDSPRSDEVLVRISGVGLCHTDLIARDQFIPLPHPAVLGHEGAGVVVAVGDAVTKVQPGDSVVMSFASCGHCARCEEQLPCYCLQFPALNYSGKRPDGSSGIRIDGRSVSAHFFGQSSFASHALGTERNVIPVNSEGLPLEILGPLGCGFQTGAGGIMRSLACPPGSSLAIFGGGPVGLAAVMGARLRQCRHIILVEPFRARREMAQSLGATHVIDPTAVDVARALRSIVADGVEYAFETSGREQSVQAALASLTSRGLLGVVGVPPRPDSTLPVNLASLITFGHRIHGIIEGDTDLAAFIPQLVEEFRAGRFPIDRLITRFAFDQINEAIEAQARGECIKAILVP